MRKSPMPILVLAVFIAGCAGVQVQNDYNPAADFSSLRTYRWRSEVQPQTGDLFLDNPLLDKVIRSSVEEELARKGYQKTGTAPDFLVNYFAAIKEKTSSVTIDNTYRMAHTSNWRYGGPGAHPGYQTYAETKEFTYEEGTVILDIVDAGTDSLLWRSSAQAEVNKANTDEKRKARIDDAVKKMLADFPPGGK